MPDNAEAREYHEWDGDLLIVVITAQMEKSIVSKKKVFHGPEWPQNFIKYTQITIQYSYCLILISFT